MVEFDRWSRNGKRRHGEAAMAGLQLGRDSGATRRSGVVDCAQYRDGRRVPGVSDWREALAAVRSGKPADGSGGPGGGDGAADDPDRGGGDGGPGFVWLGLHAPGEAELTEIAEAFDLHELAVEDAVSAHQRPKLERYGSTWFLVLKTATFVEHDELTDTSEVVETGEIMVFFGDDFVIVVRHGPSTSLRGVRADLEALPERLRIGPAVVVHAVVDHAVDDYLRVSEAVEEDLDKLEIEVFSPHLSDATDKIYQFKRELVEFKHTVAPLERPLLQLTTGAAGPDWDPRITQYFRDVLDHLLRVREQIQRHDELLDTVLQAQMTRLSVQQNTDMRKISSAAALFAVPTMIAGIYGMNFEHMPELGWVLGYPMAVAAMALLCWLLFRAFRRNNWL